MEIRIKFAKIGNMRFIGHLDIMRFFQKVMRKSALPVKYSEGFSPHQIMSFASPLGMGIEGLGEYLDIELYDDKVAAITSGKAVKLLNRNMCEGMEIISFKKLKVTGKSAMSLVGLADYMLVFNPEDTENLKLSEKDFNCYLKAFMSKESLLIEKISKDKVRILDIKPLIRHIEYRKAVFINNKAFSGDIIFMNITQGSIDNLKPELVLNALTQYVNMPKLRCSIIRTELYDSQHRSLEDYGEDIT